MSQSEDDSADEDAIAKLIDIVPVLHTDANLTDMTVQRLIQDLAQGIYPASEIATRYGLGSTADLKTWLTNHPAVVTKIKHFKSLIESDASVVNRVRLKAAHVIEDTMAATAALITDPRVPTALRLDAVKQISRQAGVDGLPPPDKAGAAAGATFNLVMQFSGGREERLTTTVVAPETITVEATGDEDGPPDEDV